jgi:UMF1 family MFS transporter
MDPKSIDKQTSWLTGRTLAWAAFDVMSSVYFGIVPNVFFPIYFQRFVASDSNANAAWGLLVTVSIIISGMAALGAAALARRISRFRLIIAFMTGLVASLVFLSLQLPLSIWIVSAAFVVAQSCYFAATTNYESYLPDIAPAGTVGRVSGFGWSIGYLGGVAGTIILLVALGHWPEDVQIYRATFGIVAMLTVLLAIPVFFTMSSKGFASLRHPLAEPDWIGTSHVLRHWREHKPIFVLLFGTMFIQSATAVVVSFTAPLLQRNFGQSYKDLLWLLLFLQLLSMPTTYISSMLSDRWSRYKPIMLVLSGWGVVLLLLAFATGAWIPWIIVIALACCLGATNAALRSFLAEAVPPGQSTAFFGISTFVGRISSALGPLLFVLILEVAGERVALLAIVVVLIVGGSILLSYLWGGLNVAFQSSQEAP